MHRWSNPLLGCVLTPWVAGLLAGLILAAQLGAPLVGRGSPRAAVPIGPRGADPVDPDAEPAGHEAPASEADPLEFARGRSVRPVSPRTDRSLPWLHPWAVWAVIGAPPSRWEWLARRASGRDAAGHFLAEGRPFRHWIQSLTC